MTSIPAGSISPLPAAAKASVNMSATQFEKLRSIIYERSGIWFADAKKYVLESRLTRRLEELNIDNFDQYAAFLTIGPYREDEFQEMFNRITINETSFFRAEPQLRIFESKVLPSLLESRRAMRRLRFWSAACSSGEEPYTLGIIVHRTLGIRLADWRIEILGTDISEKVLEIAQEGLYGAYALRTTDKLTLNRYFKPNGPQHMIDPAIKAMVSFEKLNLKDRFAAARHGFWDVIFCRNVMIYFDQDMRTQCLRMFHDRLADDGTLFVGHSETVRQNDLFLARNEPEAFAYTKVAKEARRAIA